MIINILIVSENAIRTQTDEIRLSADALIVFAMAIKVWIRLTASFILTHIELI